ncbi:MAG: glycosyltransferase family 4 protein [Rhizobiales bacterium]|nr:glycosyltransferase family 4 protein [Hyphomicrobiales bacterium]
MARIKLAFPLLGRGGWTGGFIYLKNTLRLVNARLASEIEPWLFLSPEEGVRFGADLRPLVDDRVIVDPAIKVSGRGPSLAKAIATGRDTALERLLVAAGIDVAFENASFYGARFAVPVVSWIPDFQHRHMPEMFTRLNWWRRDLGFRMQIGSGRTVMLSSHTALADLKRFYPSVWDRSHVVRFAIDLDQAPYLERGDEMRRTYALPERYLFLPNQFWRHKNHGAIVEALGVIKAAGRLGALPPVVLTGQPKDPRNPAHFSELMARVETLGIQSHFRYLGLVPYDHVLSLNATCHAMINPSRFEGWSTPIEEAKAFATPLALTDIPIHREQAPGALFFDYASTPSAVAALEEIAGRPTTSRPGIDELRAAQATRLDEHARALLATVRAAMSSRSAAAIA